MLPPPSLPLLLLACDTRRAFLGAAATGCCCGSATITLAGGGPALARADEGEGEGASSDLYLARPMGVARDDGSGSGSGGAVARPTAPPECLLPAARVGTYVYRALAVAEELDRLKRGQGGEDQRQRDIESAVRKLDGLLGTPPRFVRPGDPGVSRRDPYDLPPVVGELAVQQQKIRERRLQSIDVGLAPQLFEVGELVGERLSWDRLVRRERAREDASEVRRALNIYTTNLNFNPNRYVYGGTREEKSRRIREGTLPTAAEVIRSDLDARDLYRNAVQTALDDAAAEFAYQRRNGFDDPAELVSLLEGARVAVDKWFGFIPDEDVRQALEAVEREWRDGPL